MEASGIVIRTYPKNFRSKLQKTKWEMPVECFWSLFMGPPRRRKENRGRSFRIESEYMILNDSI